MPSQLYKVEKNVVSDEKLPPNSKPLVSRISVPNGIRTRAVEKDSDRLVALDH